MTPTETDLLILAIVVGACCLPGLALGWWRLHCTRCHCGVRIGELERAMNDRNAASEEALAGLNRSLDAVQAGMQTSDALLRAGRLSQSCRSQALQLLRAGLSPETTAFRLGLPIREVSLLLKVSQALAAPEFVDGLKNIRQRADLISSGTYERNGRTTDATN